MISDVDSALATLLRTEALVGSEVDVVLEAPTTEWAARRTGPVVDAFMYYIREDVDRRNAHTQPELNPSGRVVARRPGARFYRLSYLLTAWTTRPEDEHRLLGQLLENLVRFHRIPDQYLSGRLVDQQVLLTTALPPGEDRSLTDLWSALGGEMKPSLDVVITAPLVPSTSIVVGPPVQEPRVDVVRREG